MDPAPWLAKLVERCTQGGLDLVRAFGLAAFHAQATPEHRLPSFARENPLALVVGNTRALWPAFVAALRTRPERRSLAHPLDAYVEETLCAALDGVSVRHAIFWGHKKPRIPLQRIAAAAGLAELGPAHLSVHPEHGPWIGLRAVVVFDQDASDGTLEPAPNVSHCAGCHRPCVPALERALRQPGEPGAWIAVRDACPVGQEARYGPEQLRYHYTKDRSVLEAAVLAPTPPLEPGGD